MTGRSADPAAGDADRGDPDGIVAFPARPWLHPDFLGEQPLGGCVHVMGRAVDEYAPPFAGGHVDLIDFERAGPSTADLRSAEVQRWDAFCGGPGSSPAKTRAA